MDKMNGKDTTQLIEATKERLRWYTLEASEEEYDAEEVEALVNLLSTLEPVETEESQSDEVVLERFHEYVEMRDAEEGIASHRSSANKKKYSGLATFVKAHKFVAAAAVLIVVIVAGGSLGAVNASKGNGFFYWLNRDEKGMTMITSPENMDGEKVVDGAVEYASVDEVPEKYRKYLVDLQEIELLQEYELKYIRVHYMESYFGVKRFYTDDSGKEVICVGAFVFYDKTRLSREVYLSESVEIAIESELEKSTLERENPDGDVEYRMSFYKDNVVYYVEGIVPKDILSEITSKYKEIVFM